NIFAFAEEMQIRHSRVEDHLAFTFERNIVLWENGKLLGHTDAPFRGAQVKFANNLYWRADGSAFDFAGKRFGEWQSDGQDAGSLIADPLFETPKEGDFRLKPGSPAEKIGFVPFDYAKAGVYGDEAWKKLAAREYPAVEFRPLKIEVPPMTLKDGFEVG